VIPEVKYGAGRHFEYIDPAHFSNGMKLNFVTQPLYLFAICFVKLSVGFFLLRIAVLPFYRRLIISIMSKSTPMLAETQQLTREQLSWVSTPLVASSPSCYSAQTFGYYGQPLAL
jgi:hypothetical protein